MSILKIKLHKQPVLLSSVCITCGRTFVTEKVEAILWEGEQRIGNVCKECIKVGCQELPHILRKQSQNLIERAKILEELSKRFIEGPAWKEYQKACEDRLEEKRRETQPKMIMSRVLLIGDEIIPREEIEGLSNEQIKIFLIEADPSKWPPEILHLKKYAKKQIDEQDFFRSDDRI
jgi:hypothetical protein